jgi:hypothetical protein
MQDLDIDRLRLVPARKQPMTRSGQPPIGAQDCQQLRRQHHVAVFATLAMFDPDHHPATVNIGDLQSDRFGGAQPGRIGRRQRDTRLQARHRFEKAHNLVGAQHHRQFAGLARIGDPFRNFVMAKRHAIEKPQGAHRLVQRRPGHPTRDQVNLESPDIFQPHTVWSTAEISAQLADRMKVGSLRRWREIADRHILNHSLP